MYGSIYAGPALSQDDTPVVRYQDLHRRHAPASAGTPEFGTLVVEEPQLPVAFGDVAMSEDFGGVAFGEVPSYGATDSKDVFTFTDPDNAAYRYRVTWSANPIRIEMLASPSGKTGEVERGTKAYTAILDKAVELDSASWKPDSGASQTAAKPASKSAEKEGDSFWDKLSDTLASAGEAAGEGVSRSVRKRGRGAFAPSGRDERPVSNTEKPPEESNVGKYALWGALGLAGVGLLVWGISSAGSDDKERA
jgi:hypothetical protein